MRLRTLAALVAPLVVQLLAHPAGAQEAVALSPTRPFLPWETVETPHFAFHYPREMREWTIHVAERVESVHDAVAALVGYSPSARVNVVIDDPYNLSNGAAFPVIGAPAMLLWPVPPAPTSQIGDNRSWGEVLAVHEFAHVAHISRPSRNPGERLLWALAPQDLGPIARRGSRWLWEGYATYVEGKITGTGRPHGAMRPALLRELALEGKLPTYGQLSALGGYRGGSYAYLVGSAYLEWLARQRGDSSLVHLWRRMTARRVRTFDEAFIGVYGDAPADLYGRFTTEVTAKALRVRDELAAAGPAPGELVQRLTWNTGDPALSRDGKLVALQLRYRDRPSRVVVWKTDSEPESAAERRDRRRLVARDPQDVPAIRVYPRPKRAVATLLARDGRAFQSPRFFADGERVLLTRSDPTGDGSFRPDLYVWSFRTGALRRVTHGAALRDADPSSDGRRAVGTRCVAGFCDLVGVDLASGAVTVLARGTPTRTYDHPRWSADGRRITFGVQDSSGVWRVAVADPSGTGERDVDPSDGANRYSPTFTADGGALLVVSEASGIPEIERIDLITGATRLVTRAAGAAYAPATSAAGGVVFYLNEHARGMDLYRVNVDSAPVVAAFSVDTALAPAAKVPVEPRDTFAVRPVSRPHAYGLGPRQHSYIFGTNTSPEGGFSTLALVGTDPAGRFGYTVQGALDPWGSLGSWRGGAINAELRRFRPLLRGDLFYAIDQPSRQRAGSYAPRALDAIYGGGAVAASLAEDYGARRATYSLGASAASLRGRAGDASARRELAYAGVDATYGRGRDRRFWSVNVTANASSGRTAGADWRRLLSSASIGASDEGVGATGTVTYGAVSRGAGAFEEFAVGGVQPPLFDPAVLSQRVALPVAPVGVRAGRELYAYRLALDGGGLFTPYFTGVSTAGGFAHAFRVVGVESSSAVTSTPIVRLPGIRLQTGVGYTLDAPFRHKTRAYAAVEFRP